MLSLSQSLCLLLAAVSSAQAQLSYLSKPNATWTVQASELAAGNGLFLDPTGSMIVATFLDGSVRFLDPTTGSAVAPQYTPSSNGFSVRGFGGAAFSYNSATPYIVYAVTDNYLSATNADTRIIGLSTSGQKLFESEPLPGVQSGTPVPSWDGRFVYMNSNVGGTTGYFSIIDTAQLVSASTPLAPIYQQSNSTNPFSPLGYYHRPVRGNYYRPGSRLNYNDMLVWGFETAMNETVVGTGQIFGFQLPTDGNPLEYFLLGGKQGFQSSTPPVLTNGGLSMYWAITRGQTVCWVNQQFDHSRTSYFGFARGSPAYIGARAPPTLASDSEFPKLFGPGASASIWSANAYLNVTNEVKVAAVVSSRVAISPDHSYVYYADQSGGVGALTFDTLNVSWTLTNSAPIEADIALSTDGTMLFTGDTTGLITAYTVATGSMAPHTSPPALTGPPVSTYVPGGGNGTMSSSMPTIAPTKKGKPGHSTSTAPSLVASNSSTMMPTPMTNSSSGASSMTPSIMTMVPRGGNMTSSMTPNNNSTGTSAPGSTSTPGGSSTAAPSLTPVKQPTSTSSADFGKKYIWTLAVSALALIL